MATVTTSQLDGYFKERYGDVAKAVPNFAEIQKRIPFEEASRIGDSYHFPVFLRRSHGVTWAGGANVGTAFSLNDAISLQSKDANLSGTEFVLQEDISYGTLSRARAQGDASFGAAMDEVVLGMRESAAFYLEMALLYGGGSIAEISAVAGAAGTRTLTITNASWAPGLWANMEGAKIDVFTAPGGTHRNPTTAIVVDTIDPDARTVDVSGLEAELATIVATDVIIPFGADGEWFTGIDGILTNTGTLFGIDAATFNLWKGNVSGASSAKLTMGKVQAALTRAVVRGLLEDVVCFTSTYSWTDLNNDLSALRRYAAETKTEMTLGTNSITFYGVNGGSIEMVPHAMVKAGETFELPVRRWKRIGSTDTTFRLPGVEGQEPNFFQELQDKAGVRLRCYWDQAIISTLPARSVKIDSIDPESDPA